MVTQETPGKTLEPEFKLPDSDVTYTLSIRKEAEADAAEAYQY